MSRQLKKDRLQNLYLLSSDDASFFIIENTSQKKPGINPALKKNNNLLLRLDGIHAHGRLRRHHFHGISHIHKGPMFRSFAIFEFR